MPFKNSIPEAPCQTAYLCSVFTFKSDIMAYFQAQNQPISLGQSFILFHIFGLDDFITMTVPNNSLFNTINTTE